MTCNYKILTDRGGCTGCRKISVCMNAKSFTQLFFKVLIKINTSSFGSGVYIAYPFRHVKGFSEDGGFRCIFPQLSDSAHHPIRPVALPVDYMGCDTFVSQLRDRLRRTCRPNASGCDSMPNLQSEYIHRKSMRHSIVRANSSFVPL
jgi:hypothetical protein